MKIWLVTLFATCFSCSSASPPTIPEGVGACEGAYLVLEHFDCPEKDESKEAFVVKCKRVASIPYIWTDASSGPSCIVKATTLIEVRSCNVRCEK